MDKFDLTSGLSDLTSKQFYYVKVQSIPSQANFVLTRGMSLQPWSLQGGIPVHAIHRIIVCHETYLRGWKSIEAGMLRICPGLHLSSSPLAAILYLMAAEVGVVTVVVVVGVVAVVVVVVGVVVVFVVEVV